MMTVVKLVWGVSGIRFDRGWPALDVFWQCVAALAKAVLLAITRHAHVNSEESRCLLFVVLDGTRMAV
jgi:hypothetical protein